MPLLTFQLVSEKLNSLWAPPRLTRVLVFRCFSSSEVAFALGTRPSGLRVCSGWGLRWENRGWGRFLQSFRHSGTKPWMNKPLLILYPRNKMAHLYSQQGQNLSLIEDLCGLGDSGNVATSTGAAGGRARLGVVRWLSSSLWTGLQWGRPSGLFSCI